MRKHRVVASLLTIILVGLLPGLVAGQQDEPQLRIVSINAADFPAIVFQLEAIDGDNNRIEELQGLALFEDGRPIPEFETRPVDVGVDLYFVVDANSTIADRDEPGEASRREKVRDSIIRYADHFMDPTQLDRVTIIVPEGAGGRFLDRPSMIFPNEVINAVNFYQPDELEDVSLDRLLFMALDEAGRTAEEGRHQAIVLFSDAANLIDYPDTQEFLSRAQEQGVAVHPVILGSRADSQEIEQATMLAEPTGGTVVHMPDPVETDGLYEGLQQRGTLTEIGYRSALDSSGSHTIIAELAGAQGEANADIQIEPALVYMAVDNSRPILRVATDSDTPLEFIEPTRQPLVAQVEWPDAHPRTLVSAALLIDGLEQPLDGSVLGDDGILTFDWDISSLQDGVYALQVQVVDELGLVGSSPPLPLTIEIQRPVAVQAVEPTTVIVPTAAPTAVAVVEEPQQVSDGLVIAGAGVVLLVAFLVILAVIVLLWRSRRQVPEAVPVQAPVPPVQPPGVQPPGVQPPGVQPPGPAPMIPSPSAGQSDPGMTQIELPAFAADKDVGAYLEVLENAPEHSGFIPLSGNNIMLGRDPRRVAVPFKDRSVSRLHARILESHGTYRIYDEGSASGTYVNYERVSLAPRTLVDKDQIHFGRVHLRFHLASSRSSARPGEAGDGSSTQIFGQQ